MMPWLAVFGLVAFIIIGLVWACCAVGGAADDADEARLNRPFDRGWPESSPDHRPDNGHLANSDGLKKAGDFNIVHEGKRT